MNTILAGPNPSSALVEQRQTPAATLPRTYSRRGARIAAIGDLASLLFSFGAGFAVTWWLAHAHPSPGGCLVVLLVLASWYAVSHRYEQDFAILPRDEIYFSLAYGATALAVICPVLSLCAVTTRTQFSVAIGIALTSVLIGVTRYAVRRCSSDDVLFTQPRIVIVGQGPRVYDVVESIERSVYATVHVTPWFEEPDAQRWVDRAIGETGASYLVVVTDEIGSVRLNALARAASHRDVVLTLASGAYADAFSLADVTLGGRTLVQVRLPLAITSAPQRALKRAFDIVAAGIGLILVAPILLCATAAIAIESGLPVIYRQERVGCGGRHFGIFKLRTMRNDAERESGPTWVRPHDGRVTHIGRFLRSTSIDELPQLLNVLRGEMSIVGPRPERPSFVERFSLELPRYGERLLVAPGLTACSHLYMRRGIGNEAMAERLDYDVFYIRHCSLVMDLAFVIKTACEVWRHRAP